MPLLEAFVSPSRDDLAQWSDDKARLIDEVNREILRRNKMVVSRARQILADGQPNAATFVRNLEAPAVPIEYVRKQRELDEKDRERQNRGGR